MKKPNAFPKVTWDGCGINDTDEYASRLLTATERGRPFGKKIATAMNSHEALVEALLNIEANLTGSDNLKERIADSLRRAKAAISLAEKPL